MKRFFLALALASAMASASCATDSYHAYDAGAGYSEHRLSATQWRVSFVGSTVESQQTVEQHLLRRAAELTVQSGYDWFASRTPDSQLEESVVVTGERPQVERAAPEAVWRPRWRRRNASHWDDWDPRGAIAPETPPATAPATTTPATETRYSAEAEIRMGRVPAPPGAFDAAAILAQAE